MIVQEFLSVIKATLLLNIFFNQLVTGVTKNKKNSSNIYALFWTTPEVRPFPSRNMDLYFIDKKCEYQNCLVTNDKRYFTDIKLFDYVLFYCLDVASCDVPPPERPERQKYIFVSEEPMHYCALSTDYNGFFNLTWTFKLDSDATLKYYKVKNKKGKVIGPKKYMHWIHEMKPINQHLKRKLESKSKAAAWFVSNCITPSLREDFVKNLQQELYKYQLNLDQFGICAGPKGNRGMDECYAMLETDYYFYLAFENSFHEDYVTEKVLTAVNHFTVPVVYGGANYTRFLPRGSYLNAAVLGPKGVADAINEAIHDKEKYYEFFKWHRYYTFHDSKEDKDTDEICVFCEFLNKDKKLNRSSVYSHIKNFWI